MIAHRLNTLKHCDIIYKFENGHIIESGTYNELIEQYEKKFRTYQ